MKLILILTAFLFCFASCNNSNSTQSNSDSVTVTPDANPPKTSLPTGTGANQVDSARTAPTVPGSTDSMQ